MNLRKAIYLLCGTVCITIMLLSKLLPSTFRVIRDIASNYNTKPHIITNHVDMEFYATLDQARNETLSKISLLFHRNSKKQNNSIILNARLDKHYWTKIQNVKYIYTVFHNDSICKGKSGEGSTLCPNLSGLIYFHSGVTEWQCSEQYQTQEIRQYCKESINHTMHYKKVMTSGLYLDPQEDKLVKMKEDFIHFVPFGRIDQHGNVRVDTNNITIIPDQCQITEWSGHNITDWNTHKEILVISQFWGYGVFHFAVESIPRLALYIDFLKIKTDIKIHVVNITQQVKNYIQLIGISEARLITGYWEAKIVYLPKGGSCGVLNQPNGLILSNYYRQQIQKSSEYMNSVNAKAYIVVIKRSHRRWMHKFFQDDIVTRLKSLASMYSCLEVIVFKDDPLPTFKETVLMFYKAVVIVAPHGAGLTNVMFSNPRALVIEIMCRNRPVFCNRAVSRSLGMHYHAIYSSTTSCENMEVNVDIIINVANEYFQFYNYTRI